MGKLYAISDIHISHPLNYKAFDEFFALPTPDTSPASTLYSLEDGLILAGDVTEKVSDLRHCFEVVTKIFRSVWWVPGNHELYTLPPRLDSSLTDDGSDESIDKHLRGEAKYHALVKVARSYGVLTPEDEYVAFPLESSSVSMPTSSATDLLPTQTRRRLSSNKMQSVDFNTDPRVQNSAKSGYASHLSAVNEAGAQGLTPSDSADTANSMANLSINDLTQSDSRSPTAGDSQPRTTPPRPGLGRRTSSNISGTFLVSPPPATSSTSAPPVPDRYLICPIFTLYDYSFRPANISRSGALDWARATGVEATDEALLHPDPYPTRDDWCWTLTDKFAAKLADAKSQGLPLVLINHWPLREDLIYIPLVPRFTLWCGTKRTHDWHTRFNAAVVITGHLHVRRTDWKDGVRFEEVSMGYPRQWEGVRKLGRTIADLMREILPGTDATVPLDRRQETIWRRNG